MDKLQSALNELTYETRRFPQKAFETILSDREASIPHLRQAVLKALEEGYDLDQEYLLHFYALFLLGEFQDREFFPKLIELISLPDDLPDYLLGDIITSNLKDILYNTYNGNLELLTKTISDSSINEFIRSDLLEVMAQLYLDETIDESQWKAFLRQNIYSNEEYSYFYNSLADMICRCHFGDMLPEIRYLQDHELIDEMAIGNYDSCVDHIFTYRENEKNFCTAPMSTIESLKDWAMFQEDSGRQKNQNDLMDFEKLLRKAAKLSEPEKVRKIGRNDPCPCGSGKKYKQCCLNKPLSPVDLIEPPLDRQKWLKNYPETGTARIDGRIYLEDYFDRQSIEIDKLLYLGLMRRPGAIWLRDEQAEQKRCLEYLKLAFELFQQKVEADGIKSFSEYDSKNSIHYFCRDWMDVLLKLLKETKDVALYREVKKCDQKMEG